MIGGENHGSTPIMPMASSVITVPRRLTRAARRLIGAQVLAHAGSNGLAHRPEIVHTSDMARTPMP